ncbi:hypothetical protein HUB98_06250 [Paenibacillus barcinonensis]|uniref:Uncharacterized protein n=1 Tax=Paenibacillus barcinonensis TaxID=198119 RepID=A0A2V4VVX8_PAEBA|nr:hypothetical protein [Paenibacillus barcinonensis]PYE51617.1 hypothetical protein DFQ00_102412 [Paenibacillus barcinonensis]QKS55982.1 hypothetical protein HUB98_06250 [Paenibacillus barcinonensis]
MTNFNQMDMDYKVDYLSELLANQIRKFDDKYNNLSDAQKGSVKLGFHLDLADNNVTVTDELIEAVKAEFSSSPMADMLTEFMQANTTHVTEDQQEIINKLELGHKVSIVKFSEFGFPQLTHTVIESVKVDRYAQYENALYITHKPKRKRTNWVEIILPYQEVAVYDGWIDFDIDAISLTTITSNQHITVKQSKYTSFDSRYMADIKSSLSISPLITINSKKEVITC